ncbi:MAG TPA: Gfo/Idh/MocA family oxidoreductase [Bryobacteraceae bacterium]|nr:Gfo/Idh/MocA family oxidoreductase [Bryobacteraceae bacterium]
MRVGIIGTGAVARKHARAYRNIGYRVTACSNFHEEPGLRFAADFGAPFIPAWQDLCRHPEVDFIDVSTFPEFRLEAVQAAAAARKPVLVEKPMATNLETARAMTQTARQAGMLLGVVSQHRFDDASLFLSRAIPQGRLGRLIECDCYVKWYRSAEYYARPIKGSWKTEGGGALIGQGIHQVDLLRWLAGPVKELFGAWQLAARNRIESEDVVNAVVRYSSGATGVIQAATAFWPGYTERTEFHGTKGTAIISGDKLTTWDVEQDAGEPAPVVREPASGASDPMAISLTPFERQFRDFGDAIAEGRKPLVSGEEGYQALELVDAIYRSCRTGEKVVLE